MKILYFDCFSGISGDMTVGALVDLGVSTAVIETELAKLNIKDEYDLKWEKVVKKGITSTKFDVVLKNAADHAGHSHSHEHGHDHHYGHEHTHDHDHHHGHEPSYGHEHSNGTGQSLEHTTHIHEHTHEHHHSNGHEHDHEHSHSDVQHSGHEGAHTHHHHEHHHRHYKEIVRMIRSSGLDEKVTNMALEIFEEIGKAEAKIHNLDLDNVHFHEVGAVDSIIDIVAAAIAINELDVDSIQSSPVPVGGGKIRIDHGLYPIPAPATLEVLKGVPIQQSATKGELTTPTGAGILKALVDSYGPIPSMTVQSIGYGAGTKDFGEQPNVLRVMLGTV